MKIRIFSRYILIGFLSIFLLSTTVVFAGGPPPSVAFIFCDEIEESVGEIFRRDTANFLLQFDDELGQHHIIEHFHMETHSSPLGRVRYFSSSLYEGRKYFEKSYEETLADIDKNCVEDISSVKKALAREVYKWVDRNDNQYAQGSIFVAVHKDKINIETLEALQFPDGYEDTVIKNVDDWIIAYSSKPSENTKLYFWLVVGVIILTSSVIIYVKRKNKRKLANTTPLSQTSCPPK